VTSPASNNTAFFGHPKGLGYLAGTEVWERFSFYGMQALLMLYITKHLLTPEVAPSEIGLASFRNVVAALFGPMTDFAFAVQIFGLYGGFILVTPLIGAWLGDRVYGRTRMVTIGVLLMAAGHFAMASEVTFLLALLLLILGGGCISGNMKPQITGLYASEDSRRTRAFVIYQIAINFGALVAPLIIGTLGEKIGFHWGFGAAGIGMLVGLVIYLAGRRHLPPDVGTKREAVPPLTRTQWISIGTLLLVLIPVIFATTTAVQAYGIMIIWAETAVDREVFGFEMPVSWIFTIEAFMTIAWLFLCNRLWARWKRQSREPNDLTKHGFGNALVVISFLTYRGAGDNAESSAARMVWILRHPDIFIFVVWAACALTHFALCTAFGQRGDAIHVQLCRYIWLLFSRLYGPLLRTTWSSAVFLGECHATRRRRTDVIPV